MNFRTTAILFGMVLLLGVVLLGLALWEGDEGPTGQTILPRLAGVAAEDVNKVELERDGSRLVLNRSGTDQWTIAEPITTRADSAAVNRLVESLLKARAVSYPELTGNLALHGLDNPGLKVTLHAGEKSGTLNIGEVTIGGSKAVAFVTTTEHQRPMAVSRSDIEPLLRKAESGKAGDLAKWTNDYRTKEVFSIEDRAGTGFENVAAVKVTLPNKKQEVAVSRSEDMWKFDTPAGWGEAAVSGTASTTRPNAITGVRELVNAVLNLQALSADDFIDQPKDLKEYGLNRDNPDIIRIELKPKDGPAEVVWIGKKETPPKPKEPGTTPPSTPSQVYVQREGSPTVIRANASDKLDGLAALAADPAPLRERDLLRAENKNRIDALDITFAGQTTKLRQTGATNEWKLYGTPKDPTNVRENEVSDLLDLLFQSDLIKEFPPTNDANFADTRVEIKLWADGVQPDPKADAKAEPKLNGNPPVLQFGKKDAAGVYVRRTLPNGTKNDFILPESVKIGTSPDPTDLMAAVTNGRLEFFDAPVESFSAFQANKLTIAQGKTTTEVVKDPSTVPNFPSGKWAFTQPPEMKGIVADADLIRGDLLNFLASQQPERFIAEEATDDQLKAWQLHDSNPRMKVTVGLDTGAEPKDDKKDAAAKKDEQRVYWFGTDTADGKSVHVRQGDSKVVFTVPKSLFDKFANADLRDKTLVRFDPLKVERVKVRGWTEATGQMLVREFKREGSGWTAIEPKGYNVDPAKVEQFLKDIQSLRAKTFRTDPEHPDHRFPPEQSGFEITLDMAEGLEDVILNIAAEVDNLASRMAKVHFVAAPPRTILVTVPPDALKSYRDNAAAFAK